MGKVICNLAISLDGYISTLDHSVEFLNDAMNTEGSAESFQEFLNDIDVIVMGRKAYEVTKELSNGVLPFKDKYTFVLTSQNLMEEHNVEFFDLEEDDSIEEILRHSEKNIWLFGGAKTIKEFIARDLVDEYIITIAPIILGSGIPLFLFTKEQKKLKLIKTAKLGQYVQLHYKRRD